jgi:hypothetical protein
MKGLDKPVQMGSELSGPKYSYVDQRTNEIFFCNFKKILDGLGNVIEMWDLLQKTTASLRMLKKHRNTWLLQKFLQL